MQIKNNVIAEQGSAYFKSENVAWTFAYAAPELLLNANCSAKVDIYSFGVILWEIVTGEIPTRGRLTALVPGPECPKVLQRRPLCNLCLSVCDCYNLVETGGREVFHISWKASIRSLQTVPGSAGQSRHGGWLGSITCI